ncbi:MAG TPA: helix-turn-helix domain-containing protein [Burkholderiales bacterium]|nr:helix-turn-helix domain-containing protein [Burkholderiales bacterium]
MKIFEFLEMLRAFEHKHLPFLRTSEDRDLVIAIGCHQERGDSLTLAQLYGLEIGSTSTVQRRLSRLKRLGVVVHRPSPRDGRNLDLLLSPRITKVYQRYTAAILAGRPRSLPGRASGSNEKGPVTTGP